MANTPTPMIGSTIEPLLLLMTGSLLENATRRLTLLNAGPHDGIYSMTHSLNRSDHDMHAGSS